MSPRINNDFKPFPEGAQVGKKKGSKLLLKPVFPESNIFNDPFD